MAFKEDNKNRTIHQHDTFETETGKYYLMLGLDNLTTENIESIANTLSETKNEQLKQELVDILAWQSAQHAPQTIVYHYFIQSLEDGGNLRFAREWDASLRIYNARLFDKQIKDMDGSLSKEGYIQQDNMQQIRTNLATLKEMYNEYKHVTGKEFYVALTKIKDSNGEYTQPRYETESSYVLKQITERVNGLEIYELGEDFYWWKKELEEEGKIKKPPTQHTPYLKRNFTRPHLATLFDSYKHYPLGELFHFYDEHVQPLPDKDKKIFYTHVTVGIQNTTFLLLLERNLLLKDWEG